MLERDEMEQPCIVKRVIKGGHRFVYKVNLSVIPDFFNYFEHAFQTQTYLFDIVQKKTYNLI